MSNKQNNTDPRVEAAADKYVDEIGDWTYLNAMREALTAADEADRADGIVRVRVEAINELADHLEGMADSLDEHVTHEDVHRLLIEALGMSRAVLAALTGARS